MSEDLINKQYCVSCSVCDKHMFLSLWERPTTLTIDGPHTYCRLALCENCKSEIYEMICQKAKERKQTND